LQVAVVGPRHGLEDTVPDADLAPAPEAVGARGGRSVALQNVRPKETPSRDEPGAECMGRSRGGLTTKIHALVVANGLPVVLKLSEGQAHDGRSAADMLGDLRAGQVLIADRAYDSDLLRQAMTARGVWANIKPLARRRDKPAFSPFLYRSRNLVERIKQTQGLPGNHNPLREARRKLPRPRQTCGCTNLDASL
jgi:transposase